MSVLFQTTKLAQNYFKKAYYMEQFQLKLARNENLYFPISFTLNIQLCVLLMSAYWKIMMSIVKPPNFYWGLVYQNQNLQTNKDRYFQVNFQSILVSSYYYNWNQFHTKQITNNHKQKSYFLISSSGLFNQKPQNSFENEIISKKFGHVKTI